MTETETVAGGAAGGPGTSGPEGHGGAPEERSPEAAPGSTPALPAWLGVIGFLVLAAAIAIAWLNPRMPVVSDAAAIAKLSARLDALGAEMQTTGTRLKAAEATLARLPSPPDLGPIEQRLAALEKRPVPAPAHAPRSAPQPAAPPTPAAEAPSKAEIDAAVDAALAPLGDRLDTLEKSAAVLKENIAALGEKIAVAAPLGERLDALGKSAAALKENLATLGRKLAVTAAAIALEQGRPLGLLAGAPPALARFARRAPPTMAGLRASFANAASVERAAARPPASGQPFTKRLMDRLGDLFTVREGNQVIIGNPAEAALGGAEAALAAGDLAGALAALSKLPGEPAPAMAQWQKQAKALLAARAAMAKFAGAD